MEKTYALASQDNIPRGNHDLLLSADLLVIEGVLHGDHGVEEVARCAMAHTLTYQRSNIVVKSSVADPCHFGVDPDPRIHASN
jgi:hypothetical protein